MGIEIKNNGLREYKIYKTKFGETESGILRSSYMFDTYKGDFYIDSSNNIVGLEYEEFKIGDIKIKGNIKKVKMGIGNILIGILKSGIKNKSKFDKYKKGFYKEKKYNSENELLEELSLTYESRIKKIINT